MPHMGRTSADIITSVMHRKNYDHRMTTRSTSRSLHAQVTRRFRLNFARAAQKGDGHSCIRGSPKFP